MSKETEYYFDTVNDIFIKIKKQSETSIDEAAEIMAKATVEKILSMGKMPPIWMSANMPGGDEANKKWEKKYSGRVKHL